MTERTFVQISCGKGKCKHDWTELIPEAVKLAKGKRVVYNGMAGYFSGDDEWKVHLFKVKEGE